MNFFILIILSLTVFNSFSGASADDPKMIDYFISVNGMHCSLLSLKADITVLYNTTAGIKPVKLSFENTTNEQVGTCGSEPGGNLAQFNITLDESDKISFNFENIDHNVALKNIKFQYNLPNIRFPNATDNGTVIATMDVNKNISKSSEYYQCLSTNTFSLSNGVTLNVYAVKLKVFNVVNSSFGDSKAECSQDSNMTSTKASSVMSTATTKFTETSTLSTTKTSAEITSSTKPTSTSRTTSVTTSETTSATTSETTSASTSGTTSASTSGTTSASTSGTTTSITTASTESTFITVPSTTSEPTLTTTMEASSTPSTSHETTSPITSKTTPGGTTENISTRTTRNILTTTASSVDPKFSVKGSTICLLVQSKMTLLVTYETNKEEKSSSFMVTSSNDFNGTCATDQDTLNIYFSNDFFFTLSFTKNGNNVKLNEFKTSIFYSSKFFPGAKYQNKTFVSSFSFGSNYEIAVGKSYSCMSNLTFGNDTLKLNVLDFKFEAFRTSNTEDFSSDVTICKRDSTVAIIVGVVLAVFLIIVILIFVIFQIRAKRRQGYQEI